MRMTTRVSMDRIALTVAAAIAKMRIAFGMETTRYVRGEFESLTDICDLNCESSRELSM